MSDGLLVQTMQRIMSVLDDIDERKADIKEIYREANGHGFDKAAIGVAIREIRGRAKADTPKAQERAAIVDLYVSTFDNAPRTYVHVPAREGSSNSERKTRSASDLEASKDSQERAPSAPAGNGADQLVAEAKSPEPDATPAGAVVADTSGATAGETAADARDVEAMVEQRASAPILRKPFVLRPHCQRPEMCGSYGSKHCGECERAAKASEDDEAAAVPAFIRKTHDHAIGEQA